MRSLPRQKIGPRETIVPVWSFGDRVRKIRREVVRLDQAAFAAELGVTAQAYGAWESRGAQPRNLVPIAQRIEELTGVPAAWVLGLDTTQGDAASAAAATTESRYRINSACLPKAGQRVVALPLPASSCTPFERRSAA